MSKLALSAALALSLGLVLLAGTARADTFGAPTVAQVLPSAQQPNADGAIRLPLAFTSAPAVAEVRSYDELQNLWQRAGAAYAIPWQVLAAINQVESDFGRNMGPSSAGAVGWMQFMPSTWLRWGTDANGDGIADPWNPEDAVYSAARYLAAAGGATDVRQAVFAYNHADWYVNEVLSLADVFGSGGSDAAFSLDGAQESLDSAQQQVAASNNALIAAERVLRSLEAVHGRLVAHAESVSLFSDKLAAQKRAVLAGVRADAAAAQVDALRASLAGAESSLASARAAAAAAAISPVTGTLVSGPLLSQTGYVFPVGGGPSVVSVSHFHHDYPAADIAAPAGSPVYALNDALVTRAWRFPDPRCGIGVTMQTADGREWTYCHLSYLEPAVVPGVLLSAGASVGLVGSTGDASGPHLHLQLHPATSYPQAEAWFQSFAGSGFRWQEEAQTRALASAAVGPSRDVFAVVSPTAARSSDVVAFSR